MSLAVLRVKMWHHFVFLAAMVCIFLENIRLWFLPVSADPYVWVITLLGVATLAIDLLLHFMLIITDSKPIINEYKKSHSSLAFERSELSPPPPGLLSPVMSPEQGFRGSRTPSQLTDVRRNEGQLFSSVQTPDRKEFGKKAHRHPHVHRFVFGNHKDYYRDLNTDDKREIAFFYFFMDLIALLSIMLDLQCHTPWPKLSTAGGWELHNRSETENDGWWCPVNGQAQTGVPPITRAFRLLRFTRLLRIVGNFGQLHYGNHNDKGGTPPQTFDQTSNSFWDCCEWVKDILYCRWFYFCKCFYRSSQVEPDFNATWGTADTEGGMTLDRLQFNRSNSFQSMRTPPGRRGSRGRPGSPGESAATTVAWSLSEATNRVTAIAAVTIVIVTPCLLVLLASGTHNYNPKRNSGFLNLAQNLWFGSSDTSGGKWWGGSSSGWGGAGGGESVAGASGGSPGLHSTVLQALYRMNHGERLVFLEDSSYIEHAEVLALKINGTYYIDRYRAIRKRRNFESLMISLKSTIDTAGVDDYRVAYGSDCARDANDGSDDHHEKCLASVLLDIRGAYSREGRNNLVWLLLLTFVLWISSKFSKLLAFKALGPMEKILKDAKGVRSTLRRQLKQLGDRGVRRSMAMNPPPTDGRSMMLSTINSSNRDMSVDVVDQLDGERLLQTVEKMADLLFIGFGDAGVEIVRRHLGFSEKDTVQVFVKGTKVPGAMFGFCDIRDFTSATETLEEDVLMFVNLIGHVVHLNTSASGGFCNKNIGDAFFLVWKEQDSTSVNDYMINMIEGNKGGSQGPAPPTPKYVKPHRQKRKKVRRRRGSTVGGRMPALSRNPSVNNEHTIDETKAVNPHSPIKGSLSNYPINQPAPQLGIRKHRSRSLNQMSLLMDLGVDTNIADVLEKRTPTSAARRNSSIHKKSNSPENNQQQRRSSVKKTEPVSSEEHSEGKSEHTRRGSQDSVQLMQTKPAVPSSSSSRISSAWNLSNSFDTNGATSFDHGGRRSSVSSSAYTAGGDEDDRGSHELNDEESSAMLSGLNNMYVRSNSMDSISLDGIESIGIGGEMDMVDEEPRSPLLENVHVDGGSNSSLTSVTLPPIEASGSHSTVMKPRPPKRGTLTKGGAPYITMNDDDDEEEKVEMGEMTIVPFAEQQERQLLNSSGGGGGGAVPSPARAAQSSFSEIDENEKKVLADKSTYAQSVTDDDEGGSMSSSELSEDEEWVEEEDVIEEEEGVSEFDDDEDFMFSDGVEGPYPLDYSSPFEKLESPRDPVIPYTLADLALKALAQVAHDIDHLNIQESGAALADELIKLNVFQHQQEPKNVDDDDSVHGSNSSNASPNVTPSRTPRGTPKSPKALSKSKEKNQKSFFRTSSAPMPPNDISDSSLSTTDSSKPHRKSMSSAGVRLSKPHPVIGARPVPPRRGMRRSSSAVLSSSNMAKVNSGESSGGSTSSTKSTGVALRRPPGARGLRRVASAVMGTSSRPDTANSSISGGSTPDGIRKHSRDTPPGGAVTPTRPHSSNPRKRISGAMLGGGEKFNDRTSEGVKAMVGAFRGVGKSVHLGYGLHCGWAIEGAVGSPLKIDATYLSPDVNIASRLESLTKTYGCDILLSEAFHNRLSPPAAATCRFMDRVKVKGSSKPIDIFTYDRWVELPTSWHHGNENTMRLAKRLAHAVGKKTEVPKTHSGDSTVAAAQALLDDEEEEEEEEEVGDDDYRAATKKANNTYVQSGLKRGEWGGSCAQHVALSFLSPVQGSNNGRLGALCFPTEYKRVFEQGVRNYIAGKWHDAAWILETCRALCPSDRAPTVVLDFMSSEVAAAKWRLESRGKKGTGLNAMGSPLDWRNCRELEIK